MRRPPRPRGGGQRVDEASPLTPFSGTARGIQPWAAAERGAGIGQARKMFVFQVAAGCCEAAGARQRGVGKAHGAETKGGETVRL